MTLTRRAFLALSAATATQLALRSATGAPTEVVRSGPGPYGELLAPDANGVALPPGFVSRVVAVAGQPVPGPTGLLWHTAPDGGAVFVQPGGGWVYVSNEETNVGGVGALRFAADGTLVDGYRVLDGTRRNCAGGATPWGTWLSCEEVPDGQVYECTVDRAAQGVVRPALGTFFHEAAAADPVRRIVILTEDQPAGRLYRFSPAVWSDDGAGVLDAGVLEAAVVDGFDGPGPWPVRWQPVGPDGPDRSPATTAFAGGEGAWYADGHVFFTTKGDGRVWDLDTSADVLELLYDDDRARNATGRAPLTGVDNVTVSPGGEIFVAEDGGNMELVVIGERDGDLEIAPFLRIVGHSQSEVAGPAFHPDGTRLYLSSQLGPDGGPDGVTYEIVGPFTPPPAPPPTSTTTTTTSTSPAPPPDTPPVDTVGDDAWAAPAVVAGTAVAAAAAGALAVRRRQRRDTPSPRADDG